MSALISRAGAESTQSDAEVIVWMPRAVMQTCNDGASHMFPLETGGTYMGWWSDACTAVITTEIGPGPNASHGLHHFQPDQDWQLDQIAQHYTASGRRETYLGDWHSHPYASSGTLSWVDRRVLRRIINTSSARCRMPLMTVLWGNHNDWHTSTWRAQLSSRALLWDRIILKLVATKLFAVA